MTEICDAFKAGKAFIPFVTAGDPDLETTSKLIEAMAESGADLIEIGIPFSDPVAEGPVIQEADFRALASGTTLDNIFHMIGRLRLKKQVPLVMMTYINPVFVYGIDRFLKRCNDTGIVGLIIPDLPFEEKHEICDNCRRADVKLISMIAPTSGDRIRMIAKEAEGFLYCVSSLGVTGIRNRFSTDLENMVRIAKETTDIPCAIGFGISTPEQAREVTAFADGAIVGSAIVKIVAEHGKDSVSYVSDYVIEMKKAVAGNMSCDRENSPIR
jgi:tryptophan synthase alpha chain